MRTEYLKCFIGIAISIFAFPITANADDSSITIMQTASGNTTGISITFNETCQGWADERNHSGEVTGDGRERPVKLEPKLCKDFGDVIKQIKSLPDVTQNQGCFKSGPPGGAVYVAKGNEWTRDLTCCDKCQGPLQLMLLNAAQPILHAARAASHIGEHE